MCFVQRGNKDGEKSANNRKGGRNKESGRKKEIQCELFALGGDLV